MGDTKMGGGNFWSLGKDIQPEITAGNLKKIFSTVNI
jgi:hypothetical protein